MKDNELEMNKFINANLLSIQITNARKSNKLSQDELSVKSGLSKSTISDLENLGKEKNPTLNSLLSCLDTLGYSLTVKKKEAVINDDNSRDAD